jgi:hypothetical protein
MGSENTCFLEPHEVQLWGSLPDVRMCLSSNQALSN